MSRFRPRLRFPRRKERGHPRQPPASRRHRLRCRQQDVRAPPARPSEPTGRYARKTNGPHKGTACGADSRTCGLRPRVRLNRPVDTLERRTGPHKGGPDPVTSGGFVEALPATAPERAGRRASASSPTLARRFPVGPGDAPLPAGTSTARTVNTHSRTTSFPR